MKSLLVFFALAVSLVVADTSCPAKTYESCCADVVEVDDSDAVQKALKDAKIDPATLTGDVGVSCKPSDGPDIDCSSGYHVCCGSKDPLDKTEYFLNCDAYGSGN